MGWRLQAPICTDGTGTANMAILTFSPHVFNFVSSWVPMQGVNSPPKHSLFQTSAQLRSDRDVQNLVKYELLNYKHLCRDLLQRVIEHNPADSTAFNNLGHLLSASDVIQVQLQGGPREFTKKDLYLESIRLDNGFAIAYTNLGTLLSASEVIQVQLHCACIESHDVRGRCHTHILYLQASYLRRASFPFFSQYFTTSLM